MSPRPLSRAFPQVFHSCLAPIFFQIVKLSNKLHAKPYKRSDAVGLPLLDSTFVRHMHRLMSTLCWPVFVANFDCRLVRKTRAFHITFGGVRGCQVGEILWGNCFISMLRMSLMNKFISLAQHEVFKHFKVFSQNDVYTAQFIDFLLPKKINAINDCLLI